MFALSIIQTLNCGLLFPSGRSVSCDEIKEDAAVNGTSLAKLLQKNLTRVTLVCEKLAMCYVQNKLPHKILAKHVQSSFVVKQSCFD